MWNGWNATKRADGYSPLLELQIIRFFFVAKMTKEKEMRTRRLPRWNFCLVFMRAAYFLSRPELVCVRQGQLRCPSGERASVLLGNNLDMRRKRRHLGGQRPWSMEIILESSNKGRCCRGHGYRRRACNPSILVQRGREKGNVKRKKKENENKILIPQAISWHVKIFLMSVGNAFTGPMLGSCEKASRELAADETTGMRASFFLLLCYEVHFQAIDPPLGKRVLLPDRPWKWCNEPSDVSLSRLRLPRSASPRHPCFLPLWCLPTPSADRHKHSNESPVLI